DFYNEDASRDLWFATYATGLSLGPVTQYAADGTTIVPESARLEGNLVIKAIPTSSDGSSVTLEAELRPYGTPFTGAATHISASVPSGTEASLTIPLPADGLYHYRLRAGDGASGGSVWHEYGASGNFDFEVTSTPFPGVIDQSQTTGSLYGFGTATNGGGRRTVCQSFVPASSAITGVDLMIGTYGTYSTFRDVEVFLTTGGCQGESGAQAVASHALTQAEYDAISGGTTLPLLARLFRWDTGVVAVTPGQTYYLGIRQTDACQDCLSTLLSIADPYASGNYRYGYWTDAFADEAGSDLWFRTYVTAIPALTSLMQFDVATPLAESATSTHDSVIFRGTVTSPVGNELKLQVELKPFGTAFDGTGLLESAFVVSGSTAQIGSGVLPDGQYHWRARAVDESDRPSDWQEFGQAGNVDFGISKTIKVAVILADLADATHAATSTLHQPCKLLDQNRTYASYRDYYEDMFFCIKDYYDENTYGKVVFDFSIFDHNSQWYQLAGNQDYYAGDGVAAVLRLQGDARSSVAQELEQAGAFNIYVVVHAAQAKQDSIDGKIVDQAYNPDAAAARSIDVSRYSKLGVWVHELGHVVAPIIGYHDGSFAYPDLYLLGNVGSWDAMAYGYKNGDFRNPVSLNSFWRSGSGLLSTTSTPMGTVWVNALETTQLGDAAHKFDVQGNSHVSRRIVLEARNNLDGFSTWDTSLPETQRLVLYYIDLENGKITIPGNKTWSNAPQVDDAILDPFTQDSYLDFNNDLIITALQDRVTSEGHYEIQANVEPMTSAALAGRGVASFHGVVLDARGFNLAGLWDPANSKIGRVPIQDTLLDGLPTSNIASEWGYRYTLAGVTAGVILLLVLAILLASLAIKYLPKMKVKGLDVQKTVRILRLSRKLASFFIAIGIGLMAYSLTSPALFDPTGYNKLWPFGKIAFADSTQSEPRPDLDLHVYCPDGRHVGMNYVTGEYDVQIQDAITNGDNQGAPEWILFPPAPENALCLHSVSAHDNRLFLDANPDLASVLGSATDSYAIYARYIDPASGIFTSATLEDQVIAPGEVILHAATGTTDISLLPGVTDTEAPVTIASASGTRGLDGMTYVSDVTVTLSASDLGSGIASTSYSLDGGATYVPYPGQILLTVDGVRTVTFFSLDGAGNAEAPKSLEVVIDRTPPATASVTFQRHAVQSGSQPGSTKTPIADAMVKAFSKASGSCASGVGFNPHEYGQILDTCATDGSGVTDASGNASVGLAPGSYLLLARDPQTQVVAGVSSGNLALGEIADKFLQVIVRANGTSVPGKTTTHVGSLLHVIEPEYIEWNQSQELYPFVFDAPEGSWDITVTVSPPEGFTADYPSLSTDVTNDYKALQFTLTDIGSCWECGTDVDIEIRHQGRVIHQRRSIPTPMTESFVRRKGLTISEMEARGVRVVRKRN
ncbi:MAG: hypothetical protein AAB554_05435, partial [Patescibacteria group bacterium]